MPGLTVCFRRLPFFASDDAVCWWNGGTFVCHTAWLALLTAAWFNLLEGGEGTACLHTAKTWLLVAISSGFFSLVVAVALAAFSAHGTVFPAEKTQRWRDNTVSTLLVVQAILGVSELVWSIVGASVYAVKVGTDSKCFSSSLLTGLRLLLVSCIFMIVRRLYTSSYCTVCMCLSQKKRSASSRSILRNPVAGLEGSKSEVLLSDPAALNGSLASMTAAVTNEDLDADSHATYTKCCRKMCRLFCVRGSGHSLGGEDAFATVGALLARWFSGVDVTVSDLAALLFAVHIAQERERQHDGRASGVNADRPEFGGRSEDDATLSDVVDSFRFALGAYGWPLHIYAAPSSECCSGLRLCCRLPVLFCRKNKYLEDAGKNSCCCPGVRRCHAYNTAALANFSQVRDSDVVFASWKDDIFHSPYAVLVDHASKQIILTCRGTLSMSDCVTDAIAADLSLDELGEEFSFPGRGEFGHKGIFEKGVRIVRHVLRRGILQQLYGQPQHEGYKLLITGHSLGAGLATVVSLCLREQYKDLRCLAYSPPGGMFTLPLALWTRDFITSCVVGDDMVSRASVGSLFRLRANMVAVAPWLQNVAKYKVIRATVCGMELKGLGSPSATSLRAGASKSAHSEDEERGSQRKESTSPAQASDSVSINFVSNSDDTRVQGTGGAREMYPPGWILHLEQISEHRPWFDRCLNGCLCLTALLGVGDRVLRPRWLKQKALQNIVVSRRMTSDHFPDRVMVALQSVRRPDAPSSGSV